MLAEPVDPVLDDLADALRQAAHRRPVDAPATRRLVERDRAGLHHVPQDLAEEERVATDLGCESTPDRQHIGEAHLPGGLPDSAGHVLPELRDVEAVAELA